MQNKIMYKKIIVNTIKIAIISLIILAIIYAIQVFFLDNKENTEVEKKEIVQNKDNFIKIDNKILSNVAIAITTNVGIKYNKDTRINSDIYKEIIPVNDFIDNNDNKETLIILNMKIVSEYLTYLRTDVNKMLDSTKDRKSTLNFYISGLGLRYKSGIKSKNNLIEQKNILVLYMSELEGKINSIKTKIDGDFAGFKANDSNKNIELYLELRRRHTVMRTYVIYINQFLKQYDFLTDYNKTLLDTLINNKDALIKDAHVVFPDSGDDFLKKLNLIYDESEIKKEK